MTRNVFCPIVMIFISTLWCALVWYVQQQVGVQGTASLFALVAYAVGGPGITAVALIHCVAFLFIWTDGPYESLSNEQPGGLWFLYCFISWAICVVLSCVVPIIFVLKDVAQ